jgi:hypothetical protein
LKLRSTFLGKFGQNPSDRCKWKALSGKPLGYIRLGHGICSFRETGFLTVSAGINDVVPRGIRASLGASLDVNDPQHEHNTTTARSR